MTQSWPAPWWYEMLSGLCPERCREVPRVDDPDRVLMRQFAIIKKRAYLQQFACGENPEWFHSHDFSGGAIAIGLWGSVYDRRFGHRWYDRRYFAPYIRYFSCAHIHQSLRPSEGHTSLFIGLGKKNEQSWLFHEPSATIRKKMEYIKKHSRMVRRI